MPAPGKPFDVFVGEDQTCRQYAAQSIGLTPSDSAARSFAGAAAAGTVIGAAAGAMSGGHGGNGAADGLVAGSMIGASQSQYASRDAQRRYDVTYEQCMYAKGNQVPGFAFPSRAAPAAYEGNTGSYPPPLLPR